MHCIYPQFSRFPLTRPTPAAVPNSTPAHPTPSSSAVQRIAWQLALRELALQQSCAFPTFHQWLTQNTVNPTINPVMQGVSSGQTGDDPAIDRETYQRWCRHVRTSLFTGFPIPDYSEWCATAD